MTCITSETKTHECDVCGVTFECKSAWLNDQGNCQHYSYDDVEGDSYVCGQKCHVLFGNAWIFNDYEINHDERKMAILNRKKLCECDMEDCCDDKEGCYSPRYFFMETDAYCYEQ